MTAPFAIVIDRGNAQGFLVVPLFIFARAWLRQQWRIAALALISASLLRLYPLVLVVVFLVERKWKAAATSVAATFVITLALFGIYPGSLSHTFVGFERGLTRFSSPGATGMVRGNYSLLGMLANLVSSIAGTHSPIISVVSRWPWLVGAAYLLLVSALISVSRLPFIVRLSLALTLTSQIVPVSYGYNLIFVFIIVGELVREAVGQWQSAETGNGMHAWVANPLAVAIVVTLALNPVPLPNRLSSLRRFSFQPRGWPLP